MQSMKQQVFKKWQKDKKHLSKPKRKELEKILQKFDTLFDGGLGHYRDELIHLELEEGAIPVHAKAYSVAKMQEGVSKRNCNIWLALEFCDRVDRQNGLCRPLSLQRRMEGSGGLQTSEN